MHNRLEDGGGVVPESSLCSFSVPSLSQRQFGGFLLFIHRWLDLSCECSHTQYMTHCKVRNETPFQSISNNCHSRKELYRDSSACTAAYS